MENFKFFFTLGSGDFACPAMCPTICPQNHLNCPRGSDENGCKVADTCIPITQGCPTVCPIICPPNHISCDGGFDTNGCAMPATCVADSGN